MPQQNKNERRRKARVSYETNIRIKLDNFEIRALGSSKDISLNGIFVKASEDIPLGAECMVEIRLSGTTETLPLKMQGTIVRKESSGIGISFNSIDIDSYTHLKNLVRYNSEDPDIIY